MEDNRILKSLINACHAENTNQCKERAIQFGELFKNIELNNFIELNILVHFKKRFNNNKSNVREGGVYCFGEMVKKTGYIIEPFIIEFISSLLNLYSDKVKSIRNAVKIVLEKIISELCPHTMRNVLPFLFEAMEPTHKWLTNLGAIELTGILIKNSPGPASKCLPLIMPKLVNMMWDPNKYVKNTSIKVINDICETIENKDIEPFIPVLISAMENPDEVEECVYKLGSTTFVQTVDASALSIMVSLLLRGFREKKTTLKRTCAVIVDNMAKLVEIPQDARVFLDSIMPELEKCMDSVSDPECRTKCEQAHSTLLKIKKSINDIPLVITPFILDIMEISCPDNLTDEELISYKYCASLAESLIETQTWEKEEWIIGVFNIYLPFLEKNIINSIVEKLIKYGISITVSKEDEEDIDDDAEELCNCEFSLAYGTKILLNNTLLKLKRGRIYGLLGPNDCGKSTLMRAISNEQVDGFPPRSEVLTVYVESDIQGDMIDLPVREFVMVDKQIQNFFNYPGSKTRRDVHTGDMIYDESVKVDEDKYNNGMNNIINILKLIGFTDKMTMDMANTLSGGWRMKLALARAMIQKADIMLMDEPTNHLDVINVAWITDYICNLKGVTCIIVSHDANLLDKCCSYIINFEENLKLKLYKGNLTTFIQKVPEAKCYFELKSEKVKFKFPQPGILEGINTKGRKIMEMVDVTFTYPGNKIPTIANITLRCSLSSRVACIGRNGAGKSTVIKLLTGEMEPNIGKVWKHPNCRVAYVAQHAFHHIEQHLEKTPNQYILWRYQGGGDKEALAKSTVVPTEEELLLMKKPMEIKWTDEEGKLHKENRIIEKLSGGRKQGRSKDYEYEIKWENRQAGANSFLKMSKLIEMGFEKMIKEVDEKIAARAGAYSRPLTSTNVEKHLEDVGMNKEYGTHSRMAALSGGQKVKVVIAAAMWMQPHIVILDEPTNYLDRESLGALADAIKVFEGGVVIISHNSQFCSELCPETWVLERKDDGIGYLDIKGDVEWMKNVMKKKIEIKQVNDMVDAVKIKKKKKKTLSRQEKKQKARMRKLRKKAGEQVSEDSDDY
jgi:elongation factor 3